FHVFNNVSCIEKFLDLLEDDHSFYSHVGKIDSQCVIEYHHMSGVHAHVLMSICHITRVRINVESLQMLILSQMNQVKNVYIAISFVRNEVQNVRNYIYKTINGKRLRMCDGQPYPEDGNVHVSCVVHIGDMNQYGFISDDRDKNIEKLQDVRFKEGDD
ncbi:MAG: hypothetical protein WB421_13950, partial [Terriglobales bacterium]